MTHPNPTPLLGDLEVQVLECLWQLEQASVKEVYEQAGSARGISSNTIQSTLERLYRKDLLARSKQGREYIYTPQVTREDLMANLIHDVFGRFNSNSQSSVAAILQAAETLDQSTLDALEQEIKRLKAKE
ncbi:BlaI/MecI/CopY family transcriptional regulator [Thiomicrospira sp. R3]|uniref:BlaI/MecI/CopY family transcriptional regulator n=1 Tax=Thiomicrospira sp. R3 TaxID=3035472 RepID=UPI00259B6670|nr:BlaI/MecI/CopY family transcriptional regulator [Thiomicrospira sp. R3]WFE67713.1 BlaI/MecI/CopY family transcriptional regulator [Thiomicrospira sp. R3]